MSGPSGLHIHPEPGQESISSNNHHGSISYQTYDRHASDLQTAMDQTGTRPYVNFGNRPRRQSTISQQNAPQNNERRGSSPEYSQPESFTENGNVIFLESQSRRTSLPMGMTGRENNPQENQQQDGNDLPFNFSGRPPWNISGRSGSNAPEPVVEPPTSMTSAEGLIRPWWRRRPSLTRTNPKNRRWLYMSFPLTIGSLIGLVVVLILYFRLKSNNTGATSMPTPTILPQSDSMPITDSSIGAADVVIGTYFSTAASGVLQTRLVYNDGKGRLCIRTKSGTAWGNVQCLEGANPRADTPLTVLDWLGGPSIYFITADNYLSGIDNSPLNDTWKFSSVRDQKRPTHEQSQLASVTWFNGTSSWLYYQDSNSQLREFGLDDYRDIAWRDGSIGPLGLALAGSGIGASRWWLLADGSEVLEVFIQVSGGALHGRVYMQSVWTSDFYVSPLFLAAPLSTSQNLQVFLIPGYILGLDSS
jgi:hypothetical protein